MKRLPPQRRPQCGKDRGYRLHLEYDEYPCDACLTAHREDGKRWRHARYGPPPPLKPCGTPAAYDRHLGRGEVPCWRCRVAHNHAETQNRRRRRRKRAEALT